MKKPLLFLSCIVASFIYIGLSSCEDGPVGDANTNGSANVKFGDPTSGETLVPCSGKGICLLTTRRGDAGKVNVDFELSTPDGGPNTLTFSFNINDLFAVDSPAALKFVTITEEGTMHAHPQYNFGTDYTMADIKLCNELNIRDLTILSSEHNDNALDNETNTITVTCNNVLVTPK